MSAPISVIKVVYRRSIPQIFWIQCHSFCSRNETISADAQNTDEYFLYKRLVSQVAPWQELPYDQQLQMIKRRASLALKKFANIMRNITKGERHSFFQRIEERNGLACEILPVRQSPLVDGYRNKETFVIGPDENGHPELGFYIRPGKFPNMPICGLPLRMQKEKHQEIRKIFKEMVLQSEIPARGMSYGEGGHWKSLLLRTNLEGHTMAAVTVNPYQADQALLQKAQDMVQELFVNGKGRNLSTSLHFRESASYQPSPDEPLIHLHGESHITEELLGKTFRISPDSFFQVNTLGAEVLYESVAELAQLTPNTVLLDVCCGTGTIGILLANQVRKVLAIEEIQAAVDDAEYNAAQNGVTNIDYYCGRAEKLLKHVLAEHLQAGDDVVAVVNPGRAGLGGKVTRMLRRCEQIHRVVYASCRPVGRCCFNFTELCRPTDDRYEGKPFLPIKAIPVDMFPHTRHYELVILFER